MVTITCAKCGKIGRIPENYLNHSGRCKACGSIFRAESPPVSPPDEPETVSPAEPTATHAGPGRQTALKVQAPEGFRSETAIPRGPGPAPRIPGPVGQVKIGGHTYTLQSGGLGLKLPPKPPPTTASPLEPPSPHVATSPHIENKFRADVGNDA